MAIPETGFVICTPASIRANVPAQTVAIEEIGNIGRIEISGVSRENINATIAAINEICFVPTVGEVYNGKVVKVMDFGAFIAIGKGVEGLLHISEIEWARLDKVPYNEGDMVEVKFMGYDDRKKMKLSRKVLLDRPAREERPAREDRPQGDRPQGDRPQRRDDRREGNFNGGNNRPQHSGQTNERPAGEDTFKPLNEGENPTDTKPEGF